MISFDNRNVQISLINQVFRTKHSKSQVSLLQIITPKFPTCVHAVTFWSLKDSLEVTAASYNINSYNHGKGINKILLIYHFKIWSFILKET